MPKKKEGRPLSGNVQKRKENGKPKEGKPPEEGGKNSYLTKGALSKEKEKRRSNNTILEKFCNQLRKEGVGEEKIPQGSSDLTDEEGEKTCKRREGRGLLSMGGGEWVTSLLKKGISLKENPGKKGKKSYLFFRTRASQRKKKKGSWVENRR